MARIKYTVEYFIKSSPHILYNFIATQSGLSQWFADYVEVNDNHFTFYWEGFPEHGTLLEQSDHEYVRFLMENHEKNEFLEFKIYKSEVTDDTILAITDFAEKNEVQDQTLVWNSLVDLLISSIGGKN